MRLALIATLLLLSVVGHAQTQLIGDGPGYMPPDSATANCERGVSKALGVLWTKLAKCNIRDNGKKAHATNFGAACVVDDPSFDGPSCQATARAQYDVTVAQLSGCPACLDSATPRDTLTQALNGVLSAAAYCATSACAEDGGQPVQSLLGFVPSSLALRRCEDFEAKLLTRLGTALLACRYKAAVNPNFYQKGCEANARKKYDRFTGRNGACGPCQSADDYAANASAVGTAVDDLVRQNYCANCTFAAGCSDHGNACTPAVCIGQKCRLLQAPAGTPCPLGYCGGGPQCVEYWCSESPYDGDCTACLQAGNWGTTAGCLMECPYTYPDLTGASCDGLCIRFNAPECKATCGCPG